MTKNHQLNTIEQKQNQNLVAQYFQGPIPPPAILEAYRKIIPDAPERILKMAEKNSDYLIELDSRKLKAEVDQIKRGQNFALIAVLATIVLCGYAMWSGYPTVAGILGSLDLVGLVVAFVLGRQEKNKSIIKK